MKKSLLIIGFAMTTMLAAAPPPPAPPPPSQPPPPLVVLPPATSAQAETSVVLTTNTIVVTNAVLVTNVVLVTNAIVVTNAMVITNLVPATPYVYEQRPLAGRPMLVTPEQARAIIDRFKAAYGKLGSPRMLIYVNRELVDEQAGLKLTARSEKTESSRGSVSSQFHGNTNVVKSTNPQNATVTVSAGGNVTIAGGVNAGSSEVKSGQGQVAFNTDRVSNENTYRLQDRKETVLADKQTVRDLERLFGRPLRLAGVSLTDQRVATQLMADKPIQTFTVPTEGEQARKDREALAKIADVVLEILISSRNVVVPEVSGDKVYPVPDIQATAIRLNDSKIIGQATASDLIGKDRFAGRIVRNFDVRDIAEATALSLMEDMTMGVPQ